MLLRASACLIALLGLGASPAAAQVECGDVITGARILTRDLSCPADDPALTIDGGSLNMRDNTLDCANLSNVGIVLTGSGARLLNGSITGCDIGVLLEGGGGHRVTRVSSSQNDDVGFDVNSDENRLVSVAANDNGEEGMEIGLGSVADNNRVLRSTFNDNDEEGIELGSRANENQFLNNTLSGNGEEVVQDNGQRSVVRNNRAMNNEEEGFQILSSASGGDYRLNVAIGNGVSELDNNACFAIQGDDGFFFLNRASENKGQGFVVSSGADGNTLKSNRSFDNVGLDIEDGDGDCQNNTYDRNVFGTATDCVN